MGSSGQLLDITEAIFPLNPSPPILYPCLYLFFLARVSLPLLHHAISNMFSTLSTLGMDTNYDIVN